MLLLKLKKRSNTRISQKDPDQTVPGRKFGYLIEKFNLIFYIYYRQSNGK